jgi:hypothetical protein
MRSRIIAVSVFALSLIVGESSTASAQSPAWGDLTVSAVSLNYDLSGNGIVPAFAVRMTRDLSPHVSLEMGGVFATPAMQFGSSTLFMPEAQVRYRWNLGRLSPYVGGGFGASMVDSSFHTDWDPTLSASVGTAVRLNDRLAVNGEFRLRGHEWRFAGSTAEFSAGLAWRLGEF